MKKTVRPIRRFVLLLDDQPECNLDGGVYVVDRGTDHMDYTVVRVGTEEKAGFGQGDRVIISDPNAGRKVAIDGIVYRLVRVSDVIAVLA